VLTTLVSWNLKGSENPDVRPVADHLRNEGADVVVLQEVQWHQARRIARALGARSRHWGFKHWPVTTWPEGMAVIGVTRGARTRTHALSHWWRLWSWRRRTVQVAEVGPGGSRWTLVNVHLTPHGQIGLRAVETAAVLDLVAGAATVVVAGDLNERPDGAIHQQLAGAGLLDGWSVHDVGDTLGGTDDDDRAAGRPTARTDPWPTNWRGWERGTTDPPVQRLDYVYASEAVRVVDVHVPRFGDDGFSRFAVISDHLPVTAVLDIG
jgi:endonuclease/exonuclease/phosphatase family metal-dependent hydrolase